MARKYRYAIHLSAPWKDYSDYHQSRVNSFWGAEVRHRLRTGQPIMGQRATHRRFKENDANTPPWAGRGTLTERFTVVHVTSNRNDYAVYDKNRRTYLSRFTRLERAERRRDVLNELLMGG